MAKSKWDKFKPRFLKKFVIIEDGKINSWFIFACITFFDFFWANMAMLGYKPALTAWKDIGHYIIELSVLMIGIGLGSKRAQDFIIKWKGGGNGTTNNIIAPEFPLEMKGGSDVSTEIKK